MIKFLIMIVLMFWLGFISTSLVCAEEPPKGYWLVEGGMIKFCLVLKDRDVCSTFSIDDYMNKLKGGDDTDIAF